MSQGCSKVATQGTKIPQVATKENTLVEGNALAGMMIQAFEHYGEATHFRTTEGYIWLLNSIDAYRECSETDGN